MTKPNKQRAGLQKKVSSVFKGVSIPGGKRPGKHSHMYAPDPNAVSQNKMPDESGTLPAPQDEKVPQPELSANETSRQSTAASVPSISTDVKGLRLLTHRRLPRNPRPCEARRPRSPIRSRRRQTMRLRKNRLVPRRRFQRSAAVRRVL